MSERSQPLLEAVESGLAGLDLHVYDVEILGNGPTQILRVTIDRDGGVDLDAITAATEALSGVLDHDTAAASALRGSYTLEVTSPGLERALRTPEHFRRAVGAIVSVKTGSGADARRRRGTLVAADDGGFDLAADDGTSEHLAYDEVVKARTVFEWGTESKPKRKGKRASKHKVSS